MLTRFVLVLRSRLSLLLWISLIAALSVPLFAQTPAADVVPRLISYSGTLKDDQNRPVARVTGVTFLIYKDEDGGAPLWLETQNVQPDALGHYTVQLGAASTHGLPAEIFRSGEGRWLALQIGSEPEQPRVLLVAVPYAMKAADAETLGGFPLSAFVLASPPIAGAAPAPASAASPSLSPSLTGTGTTNFLPLWTSSSALGSSALFQSGTGSTARIGIGNTAPAATLDVTGGVTVRGLLNLPNAATATVTAGANSRPFGLVASTYNSGTNAATNQVFHWQAEPTGNNTATPSATLNLLFATAPAAAAETGLKINHLGQITFAPGQTFPGAGGTITGVTAGTGLTGGGTSGTVTLNLDTTQVPLLASANVFTNNQSVTGNFTASGIVSGSVVNASVLDVGGKAIAFGSPSSFNAFLGVAGNSTMTGGSNTGTGVQVLLLNTLAFANTAAGSQAMLNNQTGSNNTAYGNEAMAANTDGFYNTAIGSLALFNTLGYYNTGVGLQTLMNNTGGDYNVGFGYNAGPDASTPNLNNSAAIGSYADVTQSNSLVLGSIKGVNGANADTLVGIGTTAPAAKLDVHGTANFTGPVTFASGQTFPGTGTITGVTAGTALTGGGTTGGVTLNVDTTKVVTGITAGAGLTGGGTGGAQTLSVDTTKVPQLGAANTFSGTQTMSGNLIATTVGIGTAAPLAPLHIDHVSPSGGQDVVLVTNGKGANIASVAIQNTATGGSRLREGAATGSSYLASSGSLSFTTNDSGTPNSPSGAAMTIDTTGRVGIGAGLTPAFPLHVSGEIRGEGGLSLSSTGPFNVDKAFVPGGRLTILSNGNVGINNPNPQANLDVSGSVNIAQSLNTSGSLFVAVNGSFGGGLTVGAGINATGGATLGANLGVDGTATVVGDTSLNSNAIVGGNISVGGDTTVSGNVGVGGNIYANSLSIGVDSPMTSAPHMFITGFFPGNIGINETAAYVIPSKNILITRMSYKLGTNASLCAIGGTLSISYDSTGTSIYHIGMGSSNTADSGPLAIPVAANSPLILTVSSAPVCPPAGGVANAAVSVEYVMN
jgi:hypothetical protein